MSDSSSARERARELLAGLDEPSTLLGDVISDAEDELAESLGLVGEQVVELQVRLQGDRAVKGFYDPEIEAELSGPLGKELAAALGKAKRNTKLGLVDISEGSVVLHYRVQELVMDDEGQERLMDVSAADKAVRDVLELHRLFEGQATPAQVSAYGDRHSGLLKAARGVIEALSKFDLEMSSTWRSPGGEKVRSVLTRQGRLYAQGLFQRLDQTEPVQVVGRVAALDIDGSVTVAESTRHRVTVEIDPREVGAFELGESVAILAEVVTPKDQVGLKGKPRYRFLSHMSRTDPIDFEIE